MTDDKPLPPAPPSKDLLPAHEPAGMAEFFRDRMEAVELELAKERERARAAESVLRQQEALRSQADKELKGILLQLKAEKTEREREEEKSHSQGRIDALERRLDETHSAWMNLLKEAFAKREAGSEQAQVQAAASAAGIRALSESLAAAREELGAVPQTVSQVGTLLSERLAEMDRRLAAEIRRHEEAAAAWTREKSALSEAIEEQRHHIRQEYNKERMTLQARFQEQLEEFKRVLANLEKGREGDSRALSDLAALAAKTQEILSRPESAKDQLALDLEREKRDLLKALQDRTASLRAYTLERREVERSLGETLMESNRLLEAERGKQRGFESRIAELELALDGAKRREKLQEAVVVERDRLLQSLLETTDKLQKASAARAESESSWESRLDASAKAADSEKTRRQSAERQVDDLQSKMQTLSDHIAQILREKERTEGQFAQWKTEREKNLAELQKKEELLSMLSSTFQGLLKK